MIHGHVFNANGTGSGNRMIDFETVSPYNTTTGESARVVLVPSVDVRVNPVSYTHLTLPTILLV